jgi:hypothetical protein
MNKFNKILNVIWVIIIIMGLCLIFVDSSNKKIYGMIMFYSFVIVSIWDIFKRYYKSKGVLKERS